ncbi:MAG TPA: glyoxylate/hydroxypyruvate reductase A [Balneolaceae bacterium]|nr:glyoxylate/hydroxypyruvate reductase A [Balneolaceae bacterium]
MSLLLVSQNRDLSRLADLIRATDPNIDLDIWPRVQDPRRVQFAVAWNQPKQLFHSYPNLKAVSSLGAGVEHLINDESIPDHVRIVRLVLPSMAEQISDFVLMSVLNIINHSHLYHTQQSLVQWNPRRPLSKKEITVGIMGLGELGKRTAEKLAMNGFQVAGWARSKKEIPSVTTYDEQNLESFLSTVNILVSLLPLTPQTDGIVDLDLFKKLKEPSFYINVGRGKLLVDEDLIYALDTGHIQHAVLDVFTKEPLPDLHAYWNRKNITITPHVAAITEEEEAAPLIVENYKRLLSGMELLHLADRRSGY